MERHSVVFVTDKRQLYVSEFLGRNRRTITETQLLLEDCMNSELASEESGRDVCADPKTEADGKRADYLAELVNTADMVIFPTPVSKMNDYHLNIANIRASLTGNQVIYGGKFPDEWKRDFESRGIIYEDLMENEEVALANAEITAEAVVAEVIRRSLWSVKDQKIVITGYGRCAKAAAARLASLGAKITILARNREARKEARAAGYVAMDFAYGPQEVCAAGTLINTVPACVVTERMFKEMQKDILILDIASLPGGCDPDAAGQYGITVIPALSLPAVYTTKSSAKVISDAVLRNTHPSRKCMGEKSWIYQILRSDMV